jgi:hypothetical protein
MCTMALSQFLINKTIFFEFVLLSFEIIKIYKIDFFNQSIPFIVLIFLFGLSHLKS